MDSIFVLGGILLLGSMFISDWRQGIPICLWVGFLQDPLRKLVPGQPVFVNLLIVLTLALTAFAALQKFKFRFQDLFQNNQRLISLFRLFIVLVFLQAFNAFVRTNSPLVPILGVVGYLLPIFAICLTYYYFNNIKDLEKLTFTYIAITIFVAISLYLDWLKIDSPLLKPIGEALIVTDRRVGFNLITHNGIMRTSEVAAWHMGAGICATFLLFLSGSYHQLRLAAIGIIPFLFTAGLLTGRRKFIVMIVTFLIAYSVLITITSLSRGNTRFIQPLVLLTALLGVISALKSTLDLDVFKAFTTRGDVSTNDVQGRFSDLGLGSIQWSLDKNEWFGFGAGFASSGSQHLVDQSYDNIRGAAEGGLGKIIIELGIPGFIICTIIVVAVTQYLWQTLKLTQQFDPKLSSLTTGVLAFQIANFSIFTSAAQIFGDPFVLGIQGFTLGFAFASWKIMRQIQAQSRQRS